MKVLLTKNQFFQAFILLTGVFLAGSCTIQKRVHLSGYSVQWRHHYRQPEDQAVISGNEIVHSEQEERVEETVVTGEDVKSEEPVTNQVLVIEMEDKRPIADELPNEESAPHSSRLEPEQRIKQSVSLVPVTRLIKKHRQNPSGHSDRFARAIWVSDIVFSILLLGLLGSELQGGFLLLILSIILATVLVLIFISNIILGFFSLNRIKKSPGTYGPKWKTIIGMFYPLIIFLIIWLVAIGAYRLFGIG